MAFNIPRCVECGVPEYISSEHSWLEDGSIIQARAPETRMAFIEGQNWDPIWTSISEMIGASIEHIVIDVSRRATLGYVLQLVTQEVRDLLREGRFPLEQVFETTFMQVRVSGMGDPSLVDVRFEPGPDDFVICRYKNPYSIPLMVGVLGGTTEAYTGLKTGMSYEMVSHDTVDIKVFESGHPEELKGRMTLERYHPREGKIRLKRCTTCGAPAALAEYRWDIDAGTIIGRSTGRRMAMIGPAMIEPIFKELESELGEDVPRLIVEAQRRFVRSGPYSLSEITTEADLRRHMALMGLGELRELELSRKGVRVSLANAAIHLWVVGMVQGLYELFSGEDSEVEWELSEDGLLQVTVARSAGPP
jgi:hypothetical protein